MPDLGCQDFYIILDAFKIPIQIIRRAAVTHSHFETLYSLSHRLKKTMTIRMVTGLGLFLQRNKLLCQTDTGQRDL